MRLTHAFVAHPVLACLATRSAKCADTHCAVTKYSAGASEFS